MREPFALSLANHPKQRFTVLGFKGRERINDTYAFDVRCLSTDDLTPRQLLATDAVASWDRSSEFLAEEGLFYCFEQALHDASLSHEPLAIADDIDWQVLRHESAF